MRIALVSPYSWTYPGGVTRHIEALAGEFLTRGPRRARPRPVRPARQRRRRGCIVARARRTARAPDWRRAARAHARLPGQRRRLQPGVHADVGRARCARELRSGDFDVVHVHEPVAPRRRLGRARRRPALPLVGTFHCYSENRRLQRHRQRSSARAGGCSACTCASRSPRPPPGPGGASTAAATASSPTASTSRPSSAAPAPRAADAPLRLAFVGQAVERKGLPVLLRAFEALREHVPVELDDRRRQPRRGRSRCCSTPAASTVAGQGLRRRRSTPRCATPTCSCAPSLGGESFGMVLTEAFAAGTPVVASRHRRLPRRRPRRRRRRARPARRPDARWPRRCATSRWTPSAAPRMAREARAQRAERYAWPTVAGEVLERLRGRRSPMPAPPARASAPRCCIGAVARRPRPAAGPPRRLPSLEPQAAADAPSAGRAALAPRRPRGRRARPRAAWRSSRCSASGSTSIGASLRRRHARRGCSSASALMCLSMVVRGVAWHAILRAALPRDAASRLSDALQGTFIGVLMSATLPARLGEPSRALIVARRIGPPARATCPTVARHDRVADAAERRRAGRSSAS